MISQTSMFIDEIAETLLIPLYMRSVETNKKNPIINDVEAVNLVNKIDYDFSKYKNGKRSSIGVALRARYFDDKVQEFISKNDKPVVVNVGCGLDTRYNRISEKRNAVFYELDIPEVIKIRKELIPLRHNQFHIENSMFDIEWMIDMEQKHHDSQIIFIIEGVFMYFDNTMIMDFMKNLASYFPGASLHFDVINKWLSKNSHLHDTVRYTKANFKSGIDDDREYEKASPKLKFVESKLYGDFKEWKRLFVHGLLMQMIPRFKYAGRMLEYKIV